MKAAEINERIEELSKQIAGFNPEKLDAELGDAILKRVPFEDIEALEKKHDEIRQKAKHAQIELEALQKKLVEAKAKESGAEAEKLNKEFDALRPEAAKVVKQIIKNIEGLEKLSGEWLKIQQESVGISSRAAAVAGGGNTRVYLSPKLATVVAPRLHALMHGLLSQQYSMASQVNIDE